MCGLHKNRVYGGEVLQYNANLSTSIYIVYVLVLYILHWLAFCGQQSKNFIVQRNNIFYCAHDKN